MAAGKKKKKWIKWVVLAVVLILVIVLLSRCGKSPNNVAVVDTTTVTTGEVRSVLDASGKIASENVKVYASPVTAEIAEVNVKAGQEVKAGDFLVTYDTSSLESSYTQAELQAKSTDATNADTIAKSNENATEVNNRQAEIDTLNAQIEAAKTDLANTKAALTQNQTDAATVSTQLSEYQEQLKNVTDETDAKDVEGWKQAVTELSARSAQLAKDQASLQDSIETKTTDLTTLQGNLETAKAKKEAAEAGIMSENAKASLTYSAKAASIGVEDAQSNLDKAKAGIQAEFDGVVTSADVAVGTAAAEGQGLVTIADTSSMKVDFQVSKYNLTSLSVGQKVDITSLDRDYTGTISNISKIATMQASGNASAAGSASMVDVEVHIENPDEHLVIGMDAKLSIELGVAKQAVLVPIAAVNTDKDGDFVYVVEDQKVKRQAVTTGLYGKEQVQITEGLKEGEHVISVVDAELEDGTPVLENPQETEAVADTEAATLK